MNRTIDRLKLMFLGLFAILSAGALAYHVFWVWPGQKCEAAGDWWDWRSRTCARPILISDITGRPRTDKASREAAKADAAKREGKAPAKAAVPAAAPAKS